MGSWSKETKICATCKYWGGRRERLGDGMTITQDPEGRCNAPQGIGFSSVSISEGNNCQAWESY